MPQDEVGQGHVFGAHALWREPGPRHGGRKGPGLRLFWGMVMDGDGWWEGLDVFVPIFF